MNWRETQRLMTERGLSPGPIDGVLGRATMGALMGLVAGVPPTQMIAILARPMAARLPAHGITDTPARLAEFLAETCHETGGYTVFEESMRYSAKRLMAVWPRRFPTLASARPYAWDPSDPDREDVALANHVYGGRMGNERNGTADTDGWDHRGGGLIQHTGAEEYEALRRIGITPEQVHGDPESMVRAACDYWRRIGANERCDRGEFTALRKRINGGYIGLSEIATARERALSVLR